MAGLGKTLCCEDNGEIDLRNGVKRTEERPKTKTIHGKTHGKTIELNEDLGVAEGQEVEVQVTIVQPARKWGEGILRTAGALADDPEWDRIMEQIYQDRKLNRRPQVEEG